MAVEIPERPPHRPDALPEKLETEDGRRARGNRTRQAIVDAAVQVASAEGLEGLSIGRLATELGVSKSGLFAHFGSKMDLQLATVDAAREVFIESVIGGSGGDTGIGSLLSLVNSWLDYMENEVFRGGCFFAAASLEWDSRPGDVRDRIAATMGEWLLALEATIQDAQDAGELSRAVESDQLAFEINGLGMGANWSFQLYRDKTAFARARMAIAARIEALSPERGAEIPARLLPPPVEVDEGAARRALRDQIAKLERELAAMFPQARPGQALDWQVSAPGGPRVLAVGDLEALRDELAGRVEDIRRSLRERGAEQEEQRVRIETLIADPAGHKWERVSNDDIGEPGCKYWHSQPRFGLLGMLMGWWRVKISSGCP
jgi:AcrR family transcriptional regulator